MINVYIAGPFFNEKQLATIKMIEKILEEDGVFYHSPRSVGVLKDMGKEEKKNSMKSIFESNLENMDNCTHMICVLNDRDTGTLVEFGYMLAQNKPIVYFADNSKFVSVMLAQGANSICTEKTRLIDALFGSYTETVEDTI